MKFLYKSWCYAIALTVLASCADDSRLEYDVKKPESIAQQEYLNDYDVLKSYVDRNASPDFILGAGVSMSGFTETGVEYSMVTSNFDEVTAGYGMKHGAVVQDDGTINLGPVEGLLIQAAEGGLSVYGHTLVWHANQNAVFLNSTIAPTIIPGAGGPQWESIASTDFETDDASNYEYNQNAIVSFTADGEGAEGEGRALKITNEEVRANEWDCQFFVTFSEAMEVGETYRLTMDVKADDPAPFATQAHAQPYEYVFYDFFGTIEPTTEWSTYSREISVSEDLATTATLALNLGNTATTYYLDNVRIEKKNESGGGGPTWVPQSSADFETDDASNYLANENAVISFGADGTGSEGTGRPIVISNEEVRANDWGSQFFFTIPTATEAGEKYKLSMDVRSDVDASSSTQAHVVPYEYKHYDFFGAISSTPEWSNYVREITVGENTAGVTAIAFNLGNTATNYYFDNIVVSKYVEDAGGDQIIEMTPEEKADTISSEMERWISEMMGVSKDYVKAWDVVNEPMDDGNPSQLKTGVNKELAADEFYWQDYLGKEYGVMAFNLAREYGNPDDILFINDYNLEYNLDKCRGIIQYVEYIEENGATVDGIGTQMHININSDREKIVEMFELLAATGKIIKISELDIGLDGVMTSNATEEEYIAQSEMYQFVVEKYLEIIPAAQQYGITAWAPTDSPEESSWRAGEPIGLWTLDYARKRAFAGFADGLAGE
jgi:endo-1,4-beta-xylanase